MSSSERSGSTHRSVDLASDPSDSDHSDSSTSSDSSTCKKRLKKPRLSKRHGSTKKKRSNKNRRRSSEIRDLPSVDVPKLAGADDYELSKTMIELKLKVWKLTTGQDLEDNLWGSSTKRSWNSSWLKAQAVIAGSLGPRLAGHYRRLLVNCDLVLLFQEIEKECNAGSAAKNNILIKAAMFVRKLANGELVDTCIDAIMKLQEDFVTLSHPLYDPELACFLMTNGL
ncbi:hypothetical protein V7S43_017488 [Phytophthora oleae]|uniref:Uncharacterized protein n=1 Tax=Phytophthora oleae TaxID=2107226 RepID=A0ABD3EW66_9STRA